MNLVSDKLVEKIMSYMPLDNTTMNGNLGDLDRSVINPGQQQGLPYKKLYDFVQGEQSNFRGHDVKKASLI